jgi:hypothetical protein
VSTEPSDAPGPEEAAAIAAVLEALSARRVEGEAAAAPPSRWRRAARAHDDDHDAGRALRRAMRRAF